MWGKTFILGLGLFMAVGGTAEASPLRIKGGSPVRVSMHGKRETGIGLKAQKSGWRVDVSASTPDEVADVIDITDGSAGTKWMVEVRDGALLLDNERFIPGHAYRVTIRKGMDPLASALVYLYPPVSSARSRVSFDDDSNAGGLGMDGEIGVMKKPTL
jgi:hypothetical protein